MSHSHLGNRVGWLTIIPSDNLDAAASTIFLIAHQLLNGVDDLKSIHSVGTGLAAAVFLVCAHF